MSTVDEADSYRIMPRHEILDPSILTDVLHVGATPIGPYHRYCESVQPEPNMEDLIEDEEVNVAPVIEFNHAASHDSIPTEGSTETIPSQWEPESVVNVDMDESHSPAPGALLAPSNHLYRVRSQSFEHLPFFARPEHSPVNLRAMFAHSQRSQSDPEIRFNRGRRASFAGETYAHRHVRLSAHRSQNNQGINRL